MVGRDDRRGKIISGRRLALPRGVQTVRHCLSRHELGITPLKGVNQSQISRLLLMEIQEPERLGSLAATAERHNVDLHIYDHHRRTDTGEQQVARRGRTPHGIASGDVLIHPGSRSDLHRAYGLCARIGYRCGAGGSKRDRNGNRIRRIREDGAQYGDTPPPRRTPGRRFTIAILKLFGKPRMKAASARHR